MVNYSDKLKYIWWGTGACGSKTMVSTLVDFFGLVNKKRNQSGIPEGKEDYTVIVNVRNAGINAEFKKWPKYGIDYFIRCEDMCSDLQKIPIFTEYQDVKEVDWEMIKERVNSSNYKPGVRKFIDKEMLSKYWNEELVEFFLNLPNVKKQFEKTGYNLDSWKTYVYITTRSIKE